MHTNALASESAGILNTLAPISVSASGNFTGWTAAKDFEQFAIVATAGVMTAVTSFVISIEMADDTTGTNPVAIPGKTITMAAADTGKSVIINLRGSELADGKKAFRAKWVLTGTSLIFSALTLGINPKTGKGSDYNVAALAPVA